MQAKDLISDVIPAIRTNEEGLKALNWMEIFRISHLPVINDDNELIGIISDNDIYDFDLAEKKVSTFHFPPTNQYVSEDKHIFEIIELISNQKLSMVPVINDENKYIGIITLYDLANQFTKLIASNVKGAVLVIELDSRDYSPAHIAGIIEENDAKILSFFALPINYSSTIKLTIKINKTDISAIHQAFDRHGYNIKETYCYNDKIDEMLDERYDEFMTYLNI